MSLAFFHLDHKRRKRGWKPNLGQTIGDWHASSFNVEMTFKMGQLTVGQFQFEAHLVTLMCQFFEFPWQNFNTKLVGNWTKANSSNSTFQSSKQPWMKKIANTKILKPNVKTIEDVGSQTICESMACSSSIKSTLDFLMDFPRPTFDTCKVISSPATFTWLYLTFVKLLIGTVGVTVVSTILWLYLCLVSLPISLINAWMLPWMINKQYMHVTHTIGVSFGNSKPLQTWC